MNPDCNPIEQQARQDRLEAAYLASGRAEKDHTKHALFTGLLTEDKDESIPNPN